MKTIQLWMLAAILTCGILLTSCQRIDNNVEEQQTEQEFQKELDQAMSWAQVYGPPTQSLAEEVAARHNGKTTPLNYKTRESTERKCRTDNSRPFELRDLARTTVICEYDSIRVVIDDVKTNYYEIIRADTTSDATREYYKKLCIEYHSHFDPDYVE